MIKREANNFECHVKWETQDLFSDLRFFDGLFHVLHVENVPLRINSPGLKNNRTDAKHG